MRTRSLPRSGTTCCQDHSALTLIELIGILAIIALLAAVLVPSFVRQMDKMAGDQESAVLKTFGDALQRSILRNRYVPGTGDWSTAIAAEAGLNVPAVTANARNRTRYFLIDPNLRLGTNGGATLPYRQDVRGSIEPVSPRVMLLSSIGPALAAAPSSADFDNIWNWTDESTQPPTNAAFATLKRGDDLKVERIYLAPLFLRLLLTTNSSANLAVYSISTNAVNSQTATVPATWIDGYYFVGSMLGLYTNSGTAPVDSQQILNRKSSFVYEGVSWRNDLFGPFPATGGGGGGSIGIASSAYSIVTNFLAAPANTGSGASNQLGVVQSMINYMNSYDAWAGSKFTNNAFYNTALSNQVIMKKAVNGLCCSPIPPEYAP